MDAVSTFSDTTLDSSRDLVNITHLFPELGTIESVEILLGTISQLETLDDVFQFGGVPPELSEDYRSGYWVTPTILSNVDPSSTSY
jgi:hypothetical protein